MRAILSFLTLVVYVAVLALVVWRIRPWELLDHRLTEAILEKVHPNPYDSIHVSTIEDIPRDHLTTAKENWLRLEALQANNPSSVASGDTASPKKRVFVDLSKEEAVALVHALPLHSSSTATTARNLVLDLNTREVQVETLRTSANNPQPSGLTVYIQDEQLRLDAQGIQAFRDDLDAAMRGLQ